MTMKWKLFAVSSASVVCKYSLVDRVVCLVFGFK